ncbi:MAG: single-stranded-DNA-specific exonuclease RecJ [Geobacteraceae bacterium GWC2_48_7]|nr:MAG: single-stranded-DNA-specific exonuclease RecJ [Geobacteraceae bacterium GWC2_48_7]
MHKKWVLKQPGAASLLNSPGTTLHPYISAILSARGISSPEEAEKFLLPSLSEMLDPLLLKGVPEALERLLEARRNEETICIYGDYDVDGITGTTLLTSFLREAGFTCFYFIPNRFDDGYGLSCEALSKIIALGAKLIISVDCGITAVEEAEFCAVHGVDLIIVDHHQPRSVIPAATAVINPLQPGCGYPFKFLSGVGVAFNLLVALRKALREAGVFGTQAEPDLRKWLYLVAMGTIADVVPLTGQNRLYVFHGLRYLSNCLNPGIMALKKVAGIQGEISCSQVGFRLAPRLNAAGRMESAVPGVELLLGSCHQESGRIASELDAANAERQAVERRIFEEASAMVEASGNYPGCRTILLASRDWHQGVVGIVASRMVERYHRPTILAAIDENGMAKGSGRSISGFHLLDALIPCAGHLERFGGHRYAAGVGFSADLLQDFAEAFEAEAARILQEDDLIPRLEIDLIAEPVDLNEDIVLELKKLEPFGAGNPEPVLMMRGMKVLERRTVGENHLKLKLSRDGRTFAAIAFRMAEYNTEGLLDIAFYPELNEWNGTTTLQLRIKDLHPAE